MSLIWGDLMDPKTGMLPASLFCIGCGKTLNADGGHPAELYAGTFNGLCYGCTGRPAFVARISALDGCREVSWPPHCPSWRRDREKHWAYADCTTCGGMGLELTPSGYVDRRTSEAGHYCRLCLARYSGHPVRSAYWARLGRIRQVAQATFERLWDKAAGVPRKCSEKKRRELREAYATSLGEDGWRAFKAPIRARCDRLTDRLKAHYKPTGIETWREPAAEAARFEEAVRRRAADLGITE